MATAASWLTASATHSPSVVTTQRRQFGPGHRRGPGSPVWSRFSSTFSPLAVLVLVLVLALALVLVLVLALALTLALAPPSFLARYLPRPRRRVPSRRRVSSREEWAGALAAERMRGRDLVRLEADRGTRSEKCLTLVVIRRSGETFRKRKGGPF